MEKTERRKYPRVQIYEPISYLCKDSKGNILEKNIGIARNVSQFGIQIESVQKIQSEYTSLMYCDLDKNQLEIKGKIIYCRMNESGQFNIGIKLEETIEENIQFVKALVKSYFYQKKSSRLVISSAIQ
jgi:hypothetical protein